MLYKKPDCRPLRVKYLLDEWIKTALHNHSSVTLTHEELRQANYSLPDFIQWQLIQHRVIQTQPNLVRIWESTEAMEKEIGAENPYPTYGKTHNENN